MPKGKFQAMDCTKCGFSNPDAARFCAGCGHTIGQIECHSCNSINPVGSRFCISCGNSLVVEVDNEIPEEKSQAERRLLTVMFCDLVDSTTIVDSLDPEETRSIIRNFQAHARATIEKSGGRITEYLGDGIVAQFTRHETNAERAIKAGLELIQKLEKENIKIGLTDNTVQVRCGIATGLAVVGDMLGDARIRSESAIGLPLNLAARIQGLANPSEIVIAGDTFRLARGLFEFEDIGKHNLKGIKDPQQVWRVVKEKNVSSRFMAHAAEMTPMVDREDAMGVLLNCWESSKRGHADAVIFTGEAGIGKSRILQELGKKISVDDFYYLEYQCAPYHTNTALYPVISRLEAISSFNHSDSSAQRLSKLEELLRRSSDDFENQMPAFVSLLGLQTDDKWALPNLDPDEKKELIFTTLIDNMFSLSKTKPLLIKIEDVHWVDPTTLELMGRMVKALKGHSILLLITSRPGFDADFLQETHVTRLEIDRLPQQYTAQLIEGVEGANKLPKEVIDEIIKRTEGIPLFTEELSKSLMESIQVGGLLTESNLLAKKDIPTTLHDSLLSRLDRLPKASRTIAQLAAVIGRDFSFDLLEQIADYKDKNLYQDLTPLLESQLVYQDTAPPYAEFSFKHALVRDVAYENLLQSERIDIHRNIAEAIEQNYPDIIKKTPELLARHFTEGREYQKAVKYWLEAGKKASENSANIEARNHISNGLDLISKLSDNQNKNELELSLLVLLGPLLITAEGPRAEATSKVYSRAEEICEQLPESKLHFAVLWAKWLLSFDYSADQSISWANELVNIADQLDDNGLKLQAHHAQWTSYLHTGKPTKAYEQIKIGLDYYDDKVHCNHASTYGGHDPLVCAHTMAAHSLWLLGYPDKSKKHMELSIQWAGELNHLGSTIHSYETCLLQFLFRKDTGQLLESTNKLELLCDQHGLPEYRAKLNVYRGWAIAKQGEYDQGRKLMIDSIERYKQICTCEDLPLFAEMYAEISDETNIHEALGYLEEGFEASKQFELRYWLPELYRRKGLLLLSNSECNEKAQECFEYSLRLSRNESMKLFELRALLNLVKISKTHNEKQEYFARLKETYYWFTEGLETEDLLDARSLLNKKGHNL